MTALTAGRGSAGSSGGTFRSLRIRNYRIYATGALVSNIGTWMQRVAQDWLVLHLPGGNGTSLGITTGLQFLPMLLFGMWGGMLADRLPKRRLLVYTQIAMGAVSLTLGLLDVAGVVQVWHVYALAFALGVVTAVDNPARQTFVVEMVGRDDLTNAVGLNSASFNAARVVGPAVAGLLIAAAGTGPAFLINGFTYLALIAALASMNPRELAPSPRATRGPGQLREGLRYVRGRRDLVVVLSVVGVIGCLGLNFQMTTALVATEVFHKGAGEYGLLGSIMAIGSLTGALLAARRGRPRLRLLLGAATAFGVLEIAAGLMPTYLAFALCLIPVGVSSLTFITAANATMQLAVSPAMRGRVMALYMMIFMGSTPIGSPLVGWVGETFGARWSLLLGGIASLAAALLGIVALARVQHVSVHTQLRPRPALIVEREAVLERVTSA
ncbi:MAG: MFS transporter [Actinomycetales bacterium]